MKRKIVLIDGSNLIFRAYYGIRVPMSSKEGVPTNAVYGFATMLRSILENEHPTHILVAWDTSHTFRHELYPEYKGKREKAEEDLIIQFPLVRELVQYSGIFQLEDERLEADDLIGIYSRCVHEEDEVVIYSGDKDLFQLARENVTIKVPDKTEKTGYAGYNPDRIAEKYDIPFERFIDLKALMGDPSDNIPGVPGVGEKTAVKLLKTYESLDGVFEHADEIKGKLGEKIRAHRDSAYLSRTLSEIIVSDERFQSVDDIHWEGILLDELLTFYDRMSLRSLHKALLEKGHIIDVVKASAHVKVMSTPEYLQVTVENEGQVYDTLQQASELMIYGFILGDNYHQSPLLGVAMDTGNERYVLTQNMLFTEKFKHILEDASIKKVIYASKAFEVACAWQGISIQSIVEDPFLVATLVDNTLAKAEDVRIFERFGYDGLLSSKEFLTKTRGEVSINYEQLCAQLSHGVYALRTVFNRMCEELELMQMMHIYKEIELPLARVLASMEFTGIRVDVSYLEYMEKELLHKLSFIEAEIYELAGEEVNINSPKQLSELLFEKMNIPTKGIKKTKTGGYSTNVDVLEALTEYPIAQKILEYRTLTKLLSTYVVGLQKMVHPKTGKIHTIYLQTLTATGRLSSIEPNLQNIPIRLAEGRRIRKAFLPSDTEGKIFGADYSQVELRVLASITQDKRMNEAFTQGQDIHTQTAKAVYQTEDVTEAMRRIAKVVNFGIVYGVSAHGLARQTDLTRSEAKQFIDTYFEMYPFVRTYMDETIEFAKTHGYVETLDKRRRLLPNIHSRNAIARSAEERIAINSPIQGTAADIIKYAMITIDQQLKSGGYISKLILQIHDELIIDVAQGEEKKIETLVVQAMEHTYRKLHVPLVVDSSFGATWYEAK